MKKIIMVVLAVGMVAGGVTSCAKSYKASSASGSSTSSSSCQVCGSWWKLEIIVIY